MNGHQTGSDLLALLHPVSAPSSITDVNTLPFVSISGEYFQTGRDLSIDFNSEMTFNRKLVKLYVKAEIGSLEMLMCERAL